MNLEGWVKTHRKIINSTVFQNEKLFKVFMWCLFKASHKEYEQLVGRQKITLSPGQFIYGRKRAAEELNMNETTVRSYMKLLENEGCILKNSTNKFSLVTVAKWDLYQSNEEENANKKPSNEPTKDQQKTTNKNVKNGKNEKNIINTIVEYLNQKTNSSYKTSTKKTHTLINARIKEGFSLEDFLTVIDKKTDEWLGTERAVYLRPETLFGTKFESYLNQPDIKTSKPKGSGKYAKAMQELEKKSSGKFDSIYNLPDPDIL